MGFLRSVLSLMALDIEAPDHTTISRRSQQVDVGLRLSATNGRLHLIIDSTGLSIIGEGEWAAAFASSKERFPDDVLEVYRNAARQLGAARAIWLAHWGCVAYITSSVSQNRPRRPAASRISTIVSEPWWNGA